MFKYKLYSALLTISLVTLLITGCANTPPASEPTPTSVLEDTTWILESYGEPGNLQAVLEGTEITALFDSTEGQVRGSAGANHYFGGYQINGNQLSIQQIAHTEMFRLDPEGVMEQANTQQEQEYQYLNALQSAESYQIQDGKLQVDCGGRILIYTAQADEEGPSTTTTITPESELETTTTEAPMESAILAHIGKD